MYEVALLILGILIGLLPPWYSRKRRLKTHWCALRAEMDECCDKAEMLLKDTIQSPLYRLPLSAFTVSFPIILADGAVDETEVRTLTKFFSQVQDINRGLDNANAMQMANDSIKREGEHTRNCLKAKQLLKGENGQPSLFAAGKAVVDYKISLPWWKLAKIA